MSAALPRISTTARRMTYAIAAAALLGAIVVGLASQSTGWWQLAAFSIGPDLALLLGGGEGVERGQLHARAVPLYNALHRVAGPVALAALVAFGVLPLGFLLGALAWAFHVALGRALGYGLRTRDGFQRP
jgi:Domain of unknown function (DUF4260)